MNSLAYTQSNYFKTKLRGKLGISWLSWEYNQIFFIVIGSLGTLFL